MPTHHAVIAAGGARFELPEGATVLEAAEFAGLGWPSSCRNGTCRTCIRRLAAGRVTYRVEWPGLLPEEKSGGWVLPCVADAASDLTFD